MNGSAKRGASRPARTLRGWRPTSGPRRRASSRPARRRCPGRCSPRRTGSSPRRSTSTSAPPRRPGKKRTRTARAASGRARERADAARAEAERFQAGVLAPEAWATAEESWTIGQRAHAEEAHDTATARLDEAAELFEVATEAARREGMRRDRESLVHLQEETRRARGRALEAGGPALASADWTAAERRFAHGRAAAAMDAFAEGTGYFDEASNLYAQAETVARRARLEVEEAGATSCAPRLPQACRRAGALADF